MGIGMREMVSDWLMAIAAALLMGSLFLVWSHQFSAAFLSRYGASAALQGAVRNPDAWQVYSAADILLALVAGGLMAVALWGGRTRRLALALALAVGLAFTVHALTVPPTNGVAVFDPALNRYLSSGPSAGPGEVLALAALGLGGIGVLLSFTVE